MVVWDLKAGRVNKRWKGVTQTQHRPESPVFSPGMRVNTRYTCKLVKIYTVGGVYVPLFTRMPGESYLGDSGAFMLLAFVDSVLCSRNGHITIMIVVIEVTHGWGEVN